MKPLAKFCAAIALCLAASATSAWAQTPPAAGAPPAAPEAIASSSDYVLGSADKVRILVYNEPTLSGEFTVSPAGTLSLPLIGDVAATGRSATEVKNDIQARLAAGYLLSPRVSLDILTYRPFYILGEVNKPGEYPYSSGLSLMKAVALAQGFTYRADQKRVHLKRQNEDRETDMRFDSSIQVRPGDTIRIGERYF